MSKIPENQKYRREHASRDEDDERELIDQISRGDDQAMETLYRLYYDRLFRFVFRITGKVDDVEEVINDVMFVVWNKAETFDKTCRASTWIFGIAYNKARRFLPRPKLVLDEAELSERDEYEATDTSKDWVIQVELQNLLDIGLTTLSPKQRAVVELTYFNGLHYAEIADILSCPENTVKTRMYYARKKLASFLKRLD